MKRVLALPYSVAGAKSVGGPTDVAFHQHGPDKHGFKEPTKGNHHSTPLSAGWLNDTQEELCAIPESLGFTLGNSMRQALGAFRLAGLDTTLLSHRALAPAGGFSGTLHAIAASANGVLVAVGANAEIQRSTDGGATWTKRTPAAGFSGTFRGIAWNGLFLAVGDNGEIQTSPDGTTWTQRRNGEAHHYHAVCTYNATFVVVGANGTHVYTDSTGTELYIPHGQFYSGTYQAVAAINGVMVVAVGSSGEIQTSSDLVNWTRRTAAGGYVGTFNGIAADAHAYGTRAAFTAVGTSGEIQTSINGASWTKQPAPSGFSGTLHAAIARPRTSVREEPCIVAVGASGAMLASAEGTEWQNLTRTARFGIDLRALTYRTDALYLAGASGALRFSQVSLTSAGAPAPGEVEPPPPPPPPTDPSLLLLLAGVTLPANFPTPAGMLSGPWQFTWRPDWSSVDTTRPQYSALFVFAEQGTGDTLVANSLELRSQDGVVYLEAANLASQALFSTPFSFAAGQTLTFTVNPVTGRITIAGATTGNGSFSGSNFPWWAGSTQVRVGGYTGTSPFVGNSGGTFGNVVAIEEEEEPPGPTQPGMLQPGVMYWGTCGHRDQGGPYASRSIDQQVSDLKNIFGTAPNTILYRAFGDNQSLSALASDFPAFKSRGIIPVVTVITYPPWSSFANEQAAYTYGYNAVRGVCQAVPDIDVYEIGNEWDLQSPIINQHQSSGFNGTLDSHWRVLASYPLMRGAHAGACAAIRDHGKQHAQIIGSATSGWQRIGLVKALADDLVNYNGRNLIWDFTCCHWYNGTSTGGNRFGLPDNFDGGLNIYTLGCPNNPAARKPYLVTEFGSDTGGNASSNAEAATKITQLMDNFRAHKNGTGNSLGCAGGMQFELYSTGTFPGYLLYNPSNGAITPQGTAMRNWIIANPSAASGGGSTPSGTWVAVDDEASSITYTGAWYVHSSSFHESLADFAEASFTFVGNGVRYFARTASYLTGSIEIYIDNVLQTTVSNTQPGETNDVMLYENTALSAGSHTIRVRKASGNEISVGKFEFRTP